MAVSAKDSRGLLKGRLRNGAPSRTSPKPLPRASGRRVGPGMNCLIRAGQICTALISIAWPKAIQEPCHFDWGWVTSENSEADFEYF